jgi:hypothetical protein
LAKDILGKLDNARAVIGRARAVAQRAGFTSADERLARVESDFEQTIAEVEGAVRADIRRLLSGGP